MLFIMNMKQTLPLCFLCHVPLLLYISRASFVIIATISVHLIEFQLSNCFLYCSRVAG